MMFADVQERPKTGKGIWARLAIFPVHTTDSLTFSIVWQLMGNDLVSPLFALSTFNRLQCAESRSIFIDEKTFMSQNDLGYVIRDVI